MRFGDKLFLYGQYLEHLQEFDSWDYNAVMGYMTIGGYYVQAVESESPLASVPGFVVEVLLTDSLEIQNPFPNKKMVDVTDILCKQIPSLSSTRVFMPVEG